MISRTEKQLLTFLLTYVLSYLRRYHSGLRWWWTEYVGRSEDASVLQKHSRHGNEDPWTGPSVLAICTGFLFLFHFFYCLIVRWLVWRCRPRLVLGLVTTFGVYTIPVWPTQPGHPSVGRCNEWRWFRPPLRKKRRVMRSSWLCYQGLVEA